MSGTGGAERDTGRVERRTREDERGPERAERKTVVGGRRAGEKEREG